MESIGPSLRLSCQNHPDVFNEVKYDTDFAAVPEGGCIQKCEYRLKCGHSCVLSCHPFDSSHVDIQCKKPCINTCEAGHKCPKKCYEDCESCLILVDKVLSRCGHTVNAPCGKDESEIQCQHPCKESCKENHPCQKKCFEDCFCEILVDKVLSRCGHTVNALCGENEFEIECKHPCKKSCKENHPCPKKCFQNCGSCEILVDTTFTKCGHSGQVACSDVSFAVCKNPCVKICNKGHPCQKKCFEVCYCEVLIEKTLNSCGHTVKAPCSRPENKIMCTLPCKKVLSCLHQCKNKCGEPCEKKCRQLTEIQSPDCGHYVKVECCFRKMPRFFFTRCSEPCKVILSCNHLCKGVCSGCKRRRAHIQCKETCNKILVCGHGCTKKCNEPCMVKCKQLTEVQSPVCEHYLKIECCLVSSLHKFSQNCSEPCREILPCGHTCKGTCSNCHQGRLHVACKESCERVLICGHKCESKCFKSCPPCEKPCETRCSHGKCPRKCGSPCVKCMKFCNWRCKHKKCNRRCDEICDRDPCNEPCLKIMPCNHPCIGFCGEPCPKKCLICDDKKLQDAFENVEKVQLMGYVYLEDCEHIFKEQDLNNWLTAKEDGKSEGMQEIGMKTCPKCKTVIRKNVRFGKIIKLYMDEIEKVKQTTKWDRNKNLKIQSALLATANVSHPTISLIYTSIIKVLSSSNVRNIYELMNLSNIINMAKEIEFKTYGIYSMFVLSPFLKTLINYTRSCREWLIIFIRNNFLIVSEFQLQQLSREVHRINLLDNLLKFASQKHFMSLSPEFEKCALCLMTSRAFTDDTIKCFEAAFKNLVDSFSNTFGDVSFQYNFVLKVLNMSGYWYQCSKHHVNCIAHCGGDFEKVCYECDKNTDQLDSNIEVDGSTLSHSGPYSSEISETSRSNVKDSATDGGCHKKSFVQEIDSDKSLATYSRTERSCAKSGTYERPITLPPHSRSKKSNAKNPEWNRYDQGMQRNSARNKNEGYFPNKSRASSTINKTVSESHQSHPHHTRRGIAKSCQQFGATKAEKDFQGGPKKNNENDVETQPGESSSSAFGRDYRHRRPTHFDMFPGNTRPNHRFPVSNSFRNRPPVLPKMGKHTKYKFDEEGTKTNRDEPST